jgi:hypothetical protein
MNAHVVYDSDGKILALGVPLPPAYDLSQPRSGAMALPGQQVAELEVPRELVHLRLVELAQRLRVDTSEAVHRLTAQS